MYKIQKKKYRVWVDSDTATDHSFKKIIIWEVSKGDIFQRVIYANWQKKIFKLMEYQAVKKCGVGFILCISYTL